jgi:hypothetical protein
VKKTGAGFCFIGIGHKEPGGRKVRAEVSKRSHLVVWGSIVYVKIKKYNKAAVLKTRRVLRRAAMRAGKRAATREVLKHKLPPRARRLAKNNSTKGLGENRG